MPNPFCMLCHVVNLLVMLLKPSAPLLGMSEVVRRFLNEKSPDRYVTTMTIDDVGQ